MAAIARSFRPWLLLIAIGAGPVWADQSASIRDVLTRVATSLSDDDAAGAIAQFDRSVPDYDKLRDDFEGLVSSYQISNEVNVLEEQDAPGETNATISWSITLKDLNNPAVLDTRNGQIHVRFLREKNHWKIVEFSPIGIFDPRFRPQSGNPPR